MSSRLILTFPTLHKVLAAEKALRKSDIAGFRCRPTPTPPGLSESICGMSVEIFDLDQRDAVREFLTELQLPPSGCHLVG